MSQCWQGPHQRVGRAHLVMTAAHSSGRDEQMFGTLSVPSASIRATNSILWGAARDDSRYLSMNEFGCQRRQPTVMSFRPAVFDRHVPARDIAGFRQALAKRGQELCILTRRPGVEEPEHRHRRLLRASSERPCDRRAGDKRDKLAPFHVWMAPAWQEKM